MRYFELGDVDHLPAQKLPPEGELNKRQKFNPPIHNTCGGGDTEIIVKMINFVNNNYEKRSMQ